MIGGSGRLSYLIGFYEGLLAGAMAATDGDAQRAIQAQSTLLPKKLNRGELLGRLDTYCSDASRGDDTLLKAIKHIADDFNSP